MYHLDATSIIDTSAYTYYWKFRQTSLAVIIYHGSQASPPQTSCILSFPQSFFYLLSERTGG